MTARSARTLLIETRLRAGESAYSISRDVGVSHQWVLQVYRRMCKTLQDLQQDMQGSEDLLRLQLPMKSLTVKFTPAVFSALVEACTVANHKDPEEQITIEDYLEQLTINNLVEMGLLRKHSKRK